MFLAVEASICDAKTYGSRGQQRPARPTVNMALWIDPVLKNRLLNLDQNRVVAGGFGRLHVGATDHLKTCGHLIWNVGVHIAWVEKNRGLSRCRTQHIVVP
jgi:hypothetical protein